ncbi:ubiquitin carboxyl-terminal hydrolase, family 1 [Diaporthe sp. PMI_573]|nr:ubiquitin carboxyl-terminal hydrolase, family 1 [Diaporthaceae sp. PMI_573]
MGTLYRKHFIPLESNPDVFNNLIHLLGSTDDLSFQDVISLDEPSLLPRPAIAMILVFPTTDRYAEHITIEDSKLDEPNYNNNDEDIVWFKQLINNACGLYGVLHALCNGCARTMHRPDSLIARLLKDCSSLPSTERSRLLEDSAELEEVYSKVARQGSSKVPEDAKDEVDYHYVCFVRSHKSGHLYELDGDRKGPRDTGLLLESDDVLVPEGLNLIRNYMNREERNENFGLLALGYGVTSAK